MLLNPQALGLLGASASLLKASAPSRTPTSFGAALGEGLLGGLQTTQQAQQMELMNQLRTAQLTEAQRKAQQAATQQGHLDAFAQTLPEAERARFYADPSAYIKATAPQAYTLPAGGVRFGPDGKIIAQAPTKPAEPSPLSRLIAERDALPPGSPVRGIYDQAIQRQATHAPAANITNAPIISPKVGEGLGSNVKEIVSETRNAAIGALGTLETADRIAKAIEGGNVNLGPTASLRTKGDQFAQVLGIAGKDTQERLVNTRNVIRGLAQQTVEARKKLRGQGQVTENESKLIARAESGEIDDFTLPEMKAFLDVSKRLARKVHAEHKRIIGVMGQDDSTKGLIPYYDVDDLPAEAPAAQAPKKRYNPQTGRIE